MRAYERLLNYVKVYTTSEDEQENVPSTSRQFDLGNQLAEELKKIGVQDQETADDSESDSAHGPAMPHAFSDRRTAGDAARRFFRRSFVMMPASACGSMFMRVIMCASGTVFVCCFTHYF